MKTVLSLMNFGLVGSVLGISCIACADDRARATLGDTVEEPQWEQRLTVSVGQVQGGADIVGANEKAIQAAVDYVARLGGGTVKILPGTYRFRNAVYLHSNVRLLGSGIDTVLLKEWSGRWICDRYPKWHGSDRNF